MNNDYIILTDEDGQPYIAHASFREYASRAGSAIRGAATRAGSAVRGAATRAATAARGAASRVAGAAKSGARYIAKVMGRNNKVRYIYDQAELDAYNAHKSGGTPLSNMKAASRSASNVDRGTGHMSRIDPSSPGLKWLRKSDVNTSVRVDPRGGTTPITFSTQFNDDRDMIRGNRRYYKGKRR